VMATDPWTQSDPAKNPNFCRRWTGPPPLKRKAAAPASPGPAADFDKHQPEDYIPTRSGRAMPFVVVWLRRKHRLRPELAEVVAEAAGLGEASR